MRDMIDNGPPPRAIQDTDTMTFEAQGWQSIYNISIDI